MLSFILTWTILPLGNPAMFLTSTFGGVVAANPGGNKGIRPAK